MLLLALVGMEGHAAAVVRGGFLQDIALRALNDAAGRGCAVLGGKAYRLEAAVIHHQHTAGVDIALHVGGIHRLVGLTEQTHDVADVVHAQIHQCAARAQRVEHRRGLPGAKDVVPAGILAEAALYHAYRAHPGQQLPEFGVVGLVLGGHSLKEEQPLALCQRSQFLGLGGGHRHGLFHNDVLARL